MNTSTKAFDANWERRRDVVLALAEAEELMLHYAKKDENHPLLGSCQIRVVEWQYTLYQLNKEFEAMITYSVDQGIPMLKKTFWQKLLRK